MPVTPWNEMVKVGKMSLLIEQHSRAHVKEFDRWVEEYPGGPYQGGRTAFITEDGTQYDLGGPELVVLREENDK